MKYRHIIWDWNGTLWDDTWLCVEINNHMLACRGLPEITAQTYREKLCFPVTGYYCQLGFDYETDPYNRLAEEFIAEYGARRFECELQAGARELIADLQSLEIPQAVLSAYQQDALLQATDYFELTRFFQDIVGLNDIYASGKVENGLKYMDSLAVAPQEVMFIGDTVHDFEVAQAMGVQCVLVANGHNSRSRLEATGVPVFDSLAEVRSVLA
jgi:phosphoglycolate phosphatase